MEIHLRASAVASDYKMPSLEISGKQPSSRLKAASVMQTGVTWKQLVRTAKQGMIHGQFLREKTELLLGISKG